MNIFMISLLTYTLHTSREREQAQARTGVENLTSLLEESVSGSSQEIDLSLYTLQTYIEKELGDKKQINDREINLFIQKQKDWIGSVTRIHITDTKGQVQFADHDIGGQTSNYANYSFFKEAQQKNTDQLFVTKLIRDPNGQGWVHLFARRYNQADGTFAGMIITALPANYFNHLIAKLDVGPKGVVLVQDLDMRVIARNPMLKTPNGQVGFVGGPPELSQLVHSGAQSGTIYTRRTTDKIPRIGNFRKLSSMPIFVVVAFGEKDYLAQWYEDVIKAILLGLLFIVVTTIAGWLLWQQIRANMLTNRRSRMLLRNAQDGIHVLDREGKLLQGSDSFFRMIGSTPQAALGKTLCYWDNGYNKAELQELINKGISTSGGIRFETCYRNAQGECYPVEVSSVLVHLDDNEVFFCSARDITERKKAEEHLRIAATAFDSQVGMLITDPHLVILRTNRALTEITGYSEQELIGHTPKILQSGMHDKNFYSSMWNHIRTTGSWQGEIWNKRKNGELYPQHILIASVRDENDLTTHYVASITDISAYKAAEEKVHLLAFYDSLTKLPNRSLFLEHLEQSMRDAENKKQLGVILCIDLDNFKALNDTEGHETGDSLLQQVATRLLECVEANHMVARLGSDVFVVLLDQLGASETETIQCAEKTAKRILQTLAQPYFFADSEYRSSASIGISLFGLQAYENVQDPVKRADMALSEAKNYGRNTYRFFDPLIQSQVQERAEIDAGLRQSLEKNQLVLYYQPQVNGAQQVTGVEALLRWLHPVKGMISPARFIPVAEENGFIITLGQWVLESACQQLSDWAKYPQTAHLSMAVNVSASQFARDEFVQDVLEILERTQAPAHLLKLELTESALVMRVEDIIEKMTVLKRYGVMFSLDDFGTGYSSLTYLQRIPIDQLKIDQGFVRDIMVSANDAEITKMIIVLAKTLGISVLAEGVETEAQRDVLEKQGCYHYQGYLFGKPMPIDEFEQYFILQQTPH
ncbi:EAL domain-containing protein [Acinetobacter sp. ANC 5414]|uniref:bifunctional diguanylate cyclase/phosphodiesterase n=1 Tax=Acinetobacter sp. ANC 5414 TaxID=2731251 RepID=UPI00202DE033|nr:EAL domain-containing protein [Acinetobacter sp. ANC 5414]